MWLPFSFLYAIFDSLQNVYYKKTNLQINPILLAWSVLVISGLCFLPLLLLGVPHLNSSFWISVFARLILDSIAFTLFIKGVQKSPLSLTIPMTSLIPVLSIFTVFLVSHLLPSTLGFVGIFVVMCGLYFLNFDHDTKHILSPFKAVLKEKGVTMVAVASILWSIVVALQKLGIDNSNTYFYTAFFQIIWAICFTPVAYFSDKKGFSSLFKSESIKALLPAGVLDALKTIAQNLAYALSIPAYVNSIGNTGIIFSSLFAAIFFKEKIKNHAVPISIIFIGLTLIVFGRQ